MLTATISVPQTRSRTVLGFDFGLKKIGVAVGQEITGTAAPLATLRQVKHGIDWEAIGRLIRTWQPEVLVVGIPYNMDDSEQPMTEAARRFSRQLHGRYRVPVHLVDERLTSLEADRILKNRDRMRRAERLQKMDQVAAQLILETWLHDKGEHGDASG